MRRSTALFFRTACVEVERKFRPPPSAFALLSASASATPTEPPLSSTRAPSETVPAAAKTEDTWLHDLYLDAADFRLSCADHWLRRRGRSFSAASVASSADTLGGVQHWELKRPAAALSAAALASLGSNAAHGKVRAGSAVVCRSAPQSHACAGGSVEGLSMYIDCCK